MGITINIGKVNDRVIVHESHELIEIGFQLFLVANSNKAL